MSNLTKVIKGENLDVQEGVIEIIAHLADGGHRDSLTILEQLIAYSQSPIKVSDVYDLYRLSTPADKKELLEAIFNNDLEKGLHNLEQLESKSVDYSRYIFDFVSLCKEILLYSMTHNEELISPLNLLIVKEVSALHQEDVVSDWMNSFINIAQEARFNGQYLTYLEVAVLNALNHHTEHITIESEIIEKPEIITKAVLATKKKKPEVKNDEPTKKKSPKVNLPAIKLDDELVIQLMVLGDRNQRSEDTLVWDKKSDILTDFKYRRLNQLLRDSAIGISSSDFIVLVTTTIHGSNSLQEETNLELLYELLSELNFKRKIFIIDADNYKRITEDFLVLYKENNLPDKETIQIDFKIEDQSQEEPFDTLKVLEETFTNLRIED